MVSFTKSVVLGAVVVGVLLRMWNNHVVSLRKYVVPTALQGHPVNFHENLVPKEIGKQLREHLKSVGVLYTNSADTKWYSPIREDIGEAELMKNDKCQDAFLVPNKNRTHCVLPGRIDVGRHFILTGGPDGLKEPYEKVVSRLLSFGIYNWDLSTDPAMASLFMGEHFQHAAAVTCPKDKQYIDPFQGNYIVQVPGQTVAAHVDAPYFWGANRFQYPQWLLAVMVFSGLFEDILVPQVQVVGYIHEWDPNERSDSRGGLGGDFLYWGGETSASRKNAKEADSSSGSKVVDSASIKPVPGAGVSVDGSRLVHAANVYYPNVNPPKIDKSKQTELRFDKSKNQWQIKEDGKLLEAYQDDDLRISIVFRARCHKDEEEANRFREQMHDKSTALDLEEDILKVLVEDMYKRGVVSKDALKTMKRRDLAIKMMDEYIKYPYPQETAIPYNFCALPRLFPFTQPILEPFCA